MNRTVIAIDPGNIETGITVIDSKTFKPELAVKMSNRTLIGSEIYNIVSDYEPQCAVIEMVAHYGSGMPAGSEVFDTCVWIGRYIEALRNEGIPVYTIKRMQVKLNLCGQARAKDSNVTQALVDRFAKGEPNYGKGTSKKKGWFYGFKADIWQSYAVGVTALDLGAKQLEEQL